MTVALIETPGRNLAAELAFWVAVGFVAVFAVGAYKMVARGPLGELVPPARDLADLI